MEEWTRADTGVGAAIAAGSQLEKGICADFVEAAIIIKIPKSGSLLSFHIDIMDQCPKFNIRAIASKIITSPTRFISAVIIPAAKDLGFW